MGLIVCSVLLSGCAGGPRLAGTWVMVENAGRDLGVPSAPRPGDSVKELTRSRFTFGVLDAEGAIGSGGGGEWFLRDGRYHEVERFHIDEVWRRVKAGRSAEERRARH